MGKKKLTCVDLFSGAGGLSKGFLDAGYDVILGVDFDEAALKTFKENHAHSDVMNLDLFNHDNIDVIVGFLREKGIVDLDVLIGGPPCQGFSIAGPRDMNDKRNRLYQAMVELAYRLKPRAILLENVPGMIQTNNGIGAQRVKEDFAKIGYAMEAKLLYAPDYGVPQIRKRVFFVGLRDPEKPFVFPRPILSEDEYITCEEAIGDLPSLQTDDGDIIYGEEVQEYISEPQNDYQRLMREGSTKVHNHIGSIPIEKTKAMISLVPEGKNYRALPEEYRKLYKYHEALTRYHSKKPSLTINTGHRSHFHYKYNRIPTVRESARLQSFPDDFIFYGNKSQQYQQVGNAVPPVLGKVIAEQLKDYLYEKNDKTYKMIDLFAGCGGLEDGFLQSGRYEDVAAVEWLKPQVNTLVKRLETKWKIEDASERVLHFDIQRENELFTGWSDDHEFGSSKGLDYYVNEANGIDIIIGGPPCQAYSVAGRVRDENGMRDDYRNYLFEHYLSVVNRYRPKVFIFENVPGILSAAPNGVPITEEIKKGFNSIGYKILSDLGGAKVNAVNYGVPQSRIRVIILGIRNDLFEKNSDALERFYTVILPEYQSEEQLTVEEAIGDLPSIYPLAEPEKRKAFSEPECDITWHVSRYHSPRDIDIFGMLANDIETGEYKYVDSKVLSKLYEERVGSKSPIHRYHVLRKDEPSTTIIAHLYKDGNRFIHYDSRQSRSITPREAARLQSFDDDFDFVGNQGSVYQMIGNAVPPILAKKIALAVADLMDSFEE